MLGWLWKSEPQEEMTCAEELYKIALAANQQGKNEAREWAEQEVKCLEKQMISKAKEGGYSITVPMKETSEKINALKDILTAKGYHMTQHWDNITIRWYKYSHNAPRVLDCPTPPPPPKPR